MTFNFWEEGQDADRAWVGNTARDLCGLRIWSGVCAHSGTVLPSHSNQDLPVLTVGWNLFLFQEGILDVSPSHTRQRDGIPSFVDLTLPMNVRPKG